MTTNRLPSNFSEEPFKVDWTFDNNEFNNRNVSFLPVSCYASGGLNKYALIGSEENRNKFLGMTLILRKYITYVIYFRGRLQTDPVEFHDKG